jgi:hypothetical protein
MFQPARSPQASSIRIVFLLSLLIACRNTAKNTETEIESAGEPENYSATVLRIFDDGTKRETTTSFVARSGEQRREEWTEGGQARALISRPGDGKSFLLDLNSRTYVEFDNVPGVGSSAHSVGTKSARSPVVQNNETTDIQGATALGIDHYFDDNQPPTRLETRTLPDKVIDGHRCVVIEIRATYEDGHTETTRRFIATDLSRLMVRVECENDQSNTKIVTERRNVTLNVGVDAFAIPADFKKVDKLQN